MGKIRLALTPVEREWQNVPLYVTARGLTTSAIPYDERMLQLDLDCIAHVLDISVSNGQTRSIPLIPTLCVADFYERVMAALTELGIHVKIWPMPVEVPNPIRCTDDRVHATYDPRAVNRFWTVLVRIATVFSEYRASFRGRHTPVQFFWGSFDLAYARFSGQPAGAPPNADRMTRIAMDAQEISAGFWPGDQRYPEPAVYCYAYPKPTGIESSKIRPAAAFWSDQLGEFLLPYEDIRSAPSPREALLDFLISTYDAGTKLAGWDRSALDGTAR